jgi:hypothetical protein
MPDTPPQRRQYGTALLNAFQTFESASSLDIILRSSDPMPPACESSSPMLPAQCLSIGYQMSNVDHPEQSDEGLMLLPREQLRQSVSKHPCCRHPADCNTAFVNILSQPQMVYIHMSELSVKWSVTASEQVDRSLMQLMVIACSGSNLSYLGSLLHHWMCFPASDKPRSSASVVEVVTIRCLVALQSTGPA